MFEHNDDRDFDRFTGFAGSEYDLPEPPDHWSLEDFDDLVPGAKGWE